MSAAATDALGTTAAPPPSLAVIVVNWNGRDHLPECIGSLLADGYDPLRIVVVDNASDDDSVRFCRDAF
ncbi:MAG: glycosyltransferase, partial [bacterium]|nr:glycosyltransferase [bacterium]